VRPAKGEAQWAEARYLDIEKDGTITLTVPFLMPGTVIFVHRVNSQGEWYQEAARQLCAGLNDRLGRTDLAAGARSPIIPFYWGYKMQPGDEARYPGLFHVKSRGPDTLVLNSAPYSFGVKITDWLSAAGGWSDVQSSRARLRTFQAVARKIAAARSDFKDDEASVACTSGDAARQAGVHLHHQPDCDDWHGQVGRAPVNEAGECWHECGHASRDNRGKIFVNFNPLDRVIGISAIEGFGWRGIPANILGPGQISLPNVYQRLFARNSGLGGVPAVGARSGYWFTYFHTQLDVEAGSGISSPRRSPACSAYRVRPTGPRKSGSMRLRYRGRPSSRRTSTRVRRGSTAPTMTRTPRRSGKILLPSRGTTSQKPRSLDTARHRTR
jgi:hypothetical protein